jgi:hypothetical protein
MRLVVFLFLSACCLAQSHTVCESHTDADSSVSTCQNDEQKIVTRCNADGCTSSDGPTNIEISPATLRKLCDEGMEHFCDDLRSQLPKADSNDEMKKDQEVLERAQVRAKNKFNDATLRLCDKKIFDKDYCDAFKAKLAKNDKPAAPAPSSNAASSPPTGSH